MEDFDQRVRERAYRLWVEEGCPEGRSDVHWDRARELVAIEENHKLATKPVENAGEFPTMTDQGEEQAAPKRRGAASPRATKAKPAAAPKETRIKRR